MTRTAPVVPIVVALGLLNLAVGRFRINWEGGRAGRRRGAASGEGEEAQHEHEHEQQEEEEDYPDELDYRASGGWGRPATGGSSRRRRGQEEERLDLDPDLDPEQEQEQEQDPDPDRSDGEYGSDVGTDGDSSDAHLDDGPCADDFYGTEGAGEQRGRREKRGTPGRFAAWEHVADPLAGQNNVLTLLVGSVKRITRGARPSGTAGTAIEEPRDVRRPTNPLFGNRAARKSDEMRALVERAKAAEVERESIEREYESSSSQLQATQNQLQALSKTNGYLKAQLRDIQRTSESAVMTERRKADEEMARVRESLVTVLERERRLMRAQMMNASKRLNSMMNEQMDDDDDDEDYDDEFEG